MEKQDLLELNYEERKYIKIVRDESERSISLVNASDVLRLNPIGAAAVKVLNFIPSKKQEKRPDVRYVLRNEVYGVLFPGDGIPQNSVTYICNPVDHRRYYTVDEFHKEMLDHKIYEATYLLRSLGATEINVMMMDEAGKQADLNFLFGKFSSNNDFASNKSYKQSYSLSYEASDKPPFIPDDVYWIDREPLWRQIANERINNGLKSFKLDIEIKEDFGINAEMASILKGTAGNVNGNYHEFRKTAIALVGEFS